MSSDDILKTTKEYIQEAKEKGLDHAAAALEHYLSGKGTPFKIDKEWFRSYDSVIEAEEINIRRFFGVEMGSSQGESNTKSAKGTPLIALEQINKKYGGMEKMKIGETVTFNDYWVVAIPFGMDKNSTKKADIFFTLGESALKTSAQVTVTKINESEYKFSISNVNYTLNDYYDWHGKGNGNKDVSASSYRINQYTNGEIKGMAINFQDEAMVKLEKEKGAKPFAYDLNYSGRNRSEVIDLREISNTYIRKGDKWQTVKKIGIF